jgi:Acetyltransferases, including N-acetylases of ribosomal proteins
LRGYARDGHALWAVELARSGEVIGQRGITRQRVEEASVLEIGYLFDRAPWGHGYATEAAPALDIAFEQLSAERVYAIVRDTNLASMSVGYGQG